MGERVDNSAGSRLRWVSPPVAPQPERDKLPGEAQRHYGAVVLPGLGRQVYVNDVVEVLPKHNNSGYSEKGCSRLSQVVSLWEDTFTGVSKFRARWLIHASDLPEDALSRLRAARRSFSRSGRSSKGDTWRCDDEVGDEVFLTPKMDDLEVRLIARPVMLSVTSSPETEITVELEGKVGPRLTHSYDDSTGDFVPVDNTDSILKRARVRQSEAVDFASRANQEHEATKNGEPVKSTGWLLPTRSVFNRKGRGEIGSSYCRVNEVETGSYSSLVSPVHVGSSASDTDTRTSNSSEPGAFSNSKNEEGEKRDGRDSEQNDQDNDLSGSSMQNATVKKGFVPRKSTGQQKSQWSSDNDAKIISVSSVASLCSTSNLSPSSQRRSYMAATTGAQPFRPRPRRLDMPPVSEGWQKVAVLVRGGDVCTAIDNHLKARQTRSSSTKTASEAKGKDSRRLQRSSSSSLPSTVKQPIVSEKKRGKCLTTSSTGIFANKNSANKKAEKEDSDYRPRHTPVGKKFQAVIPELLSCEGRKKSSAGTGAQMVWRSIRDWDPQSRGMLADYLHTAKEVVKAKQERPGVAVHLRLSGGCAGVGQKEDPIDNNDFAGSYAVWALTASRDTCGVARLACSEMAQAKVPRSAVQRVQCEEEALAALVKTHCTLENIEPALDFLANTSSGPQSVEQWTLAQVRTLERALHDEFDPKRHIHGWAKSGMAMDGEDFIDLAKVSKRVPGKSPAKIVDGDDGALRVFHSSSHFPAVHSPADQPQNGSCQTPANVTSATFRSIFISKNGRYMVFSRTLVISTNPTLRPTLDPTLVLFFGNALAPIKATEARRQEKIRLGCVVDKPGCWGGGPARDKSHTIILSAGAAQTSDESPRVIHGKEGIGIGGGGGSSLPKRRLSFKLQDVELSSYKPPQEHNFKASKTNLDQSTTADRLVAEVGHKKAEQQLRQFTTGQRSSGASTSSVSIARKKNSCHAADDTAPICFGPTKKTFDSTYNDQEGAHRDGNETTPKTCAATNKKASIDREADGGRNHHSVALQYRRTEHHSTVSSVPLPKSEVEAAAKHLGTLARHELKWAERRTCALSESAPAEIVQPSPTNSVRSQPTAPKISSNKERTWMDLFTCTPRVVQMNDTGLNEGQRHFIWDSRSDINPNPDAPRIQRSCGRSICGVGNANSALELGAAPSESNIQRSPEETLSNDMFGMMAPCWRLLARTKAHLDKDQLLYMRELILTHAKKPMSRDQLLERAESCLQKQGHIFAAFVMMFDRIDQPPSIPLYPVKKRQSGPSPPSAPRQVTAYTSTYAPPAAVAEHRGAGPYVPAPSAFWGGIGEHKTVHPNHANNSGADAGRSPHAFSHLHPVAIMPEGSSCLPRFDGGGGGFGLYPSRRGFPAMPITTYSRQDASYPANAFNVGERVWTQQPLHQRAQWQIDSRNAVVAAVAKEEEAARAGEERLRSRSGSGSSR